MSSRLLALLVALSLGGFPRGAVAQEQPVPQPTAAAALSVAIPVLSIETIYHPEQRFEYIEAPAPATRWLGAADDSPRLLVKRKAGWMQLDPAAALPVAPSDPLNPSAPATPQPETAPPTQADPPAAVHFVETPWPGQQQLVEQLVSLGGVETKLAESVVQAWIANPARSLDSSLVRIDRSLAIAGLKETPRWITRQAAAWQNATLSPDSTRLAFVQDNDLHVLQLDTGQLSRITDDGSPTRLNGRLDWVYQEELYGRGNYQAFWWSPDSTRIALLRLDNSQVMPFTITTSDQPRGGTLVDRYPKAGDPLTHAELWLATLVDPAESRFALQPVFTPPREEERLIVRVSWQAETGDLIFQHTNRLQNELTLARFAPSAARGPESTPILREACAQWLEVIGTPDWLPGGDFLWLSDLPSGRRRLWRVSGDGGRRLPLTPDGFDVRDLVSVDAARQVAFITGDSQRGTVGQHLYRISLHPDASPASHPPLQRLTDSLPWHDVTLSPDHRWLVDRATSLTQPPRLSLQPLAQESDAPAAAAALAAARVLHRERLRLPGPIIEPNWVRIPTADGIELPAYFYRPPAHPPADGSPADPAARFPVLIEVYGGPLAPSVRDQWSTTRFLFHQHLAQQGIGVLVVDNRSSGGRGLADAWSIHRRVGELESQDTVAAADWLRAQDWVDPARLALRGWSFGGFLTLHAMTHSDRFAAGIAGGSVTDWRNYDAIYAERYMGLPKANPSGYEATSPVAAAGKLSGELLLIHGDVDDNVHLANTLQMVAALQRVGKSLELMIYPGSAHGVQPGMPTYHLMRTSVDFLRRKLHVAP